RGPAIAEGVARGLRNLVQDLEALGATLGGEGRRPTTPGGVNPDLRSPAQLVDAVVLTAADGIEDLAAGLMRANELASVAERVTNRASPNREAARSGPRASASAQHPLLRQGRWGPHGRPEFVAGTRGERSATRRQIACGGDLADRRAEARSPPRELTPRPGHREAA